MSLNSLPAELTAWITSYLVELPPVTSFWTPYCASSKKGLSRYAGSSIELQHAIERDLFSKLTVTSDDLATFDELVSSCSRRKASLQELSFSPVLPAYSDSACARYERPADRERNDEAYKTAIEKLFASLPCCDDTKDGGPIQLTLENPYAPTDTCSIDRQTLESREWDVQIGLRKDMFDGRFAHSYVCFNLSDDTPAVKRVTRLVAHGDGPRYVSPSSMFTLLKKLPCVNDLALSLYDKERKLPELRKRLRIDFAKALCTGQSDVLETLSLDYQHRGPIDERFTNFDVRGTCGDLEFDVFSTSLGCFLSGYCKLTKVSLGGPICIDEGIFLPPNPNADNDQWTSLQELSIDMSLVRPDGKWYLEKHPDFPLEEPSRRAEFYEWHDSDDEDALSESILSDHAVNSTSAQHDVSPDSYDKYGDCLRTGGVFHSYFCS
jgi:hypothetical protein